MTNDIDYNQLGRRIKRDRQKAHLPQEQLADKIDVAASAIAYGENGTSKPSLPVIDIYIERACWSVTSSKEVKTVG